MKTFNKGDIYVDKDTAVWFYFDGTEWLKINFIISTDKDNENSWI